MSTEPIMEFKGEYRFLSNFWIAPQVRRTLDLDYMWVTPYHPPPTHKFFCNEQWYVYHKCLHNEDRAHVLTLTKPGEIKRYGRQIDLHPLFEKFKVIIMKDGLQAKFYQNEDLKQQLIKTGYRPLIEGNNWNDTFWGVNLNPRKGPVGVGLNILGHCLMYIRATLIAKI